MCVGESGEVQLDQVLMSQSGTSPLGVSCGGRTEEPQVQGIMGNARIQLVLNSLGKNTIMEGEPYSGTPFHRYAIDCLVTIIGPLGLRDV